MSKAAEATKEGMVRVTIPSPWGGDFHQTLTPLEAEKIAREISDAVNRARKIMKPKRKFGDH